MENKIVSTENTSVSKVNSWSKLPSNALEKIYGYLNRKDRVRMSLVCRNWSKDFSAPSLWRYAKFYLPEEEHFSVPYHEIRFAQKYGSKFHHVEIICKSVRTDLLEVICNQLMLFLQELTFRSKLKSVAFIDMGNYFIYLDDFVYQDIFQGIVKFLSSQSELNSLELRNTNFKCSEAVEVLRAICTRSSGTLKILQLDGFVDETADDQLTCPVLDPAVNYDMFMNLQKIVTDYTQIFENILLSFLEYSKNSEFHGKEGSLESLKIRCDASRRVNYRGIFPDSWKHLKKVCPAVTVEFFFQAGSFTRNSMDQFIVRDMPIRSLDFRWDKPHIVRSDYEMGGFFSLLVACRIVEHLEELSLMWMQVGNIAQDLIHFVQKATKLRVLQIYLRHPVGGLSSVFDAWLVDKPGVLENVYISIGDVPSPWSIKRYTDLADGFAPLFQEIGMNLILLAEPNFGYGDVE